MTVLSELQSWFINHGSDSRNGSDGISIVTLDNPGWWVTISLFGTALATKQFQAIKIDRSSDNWLQCRVENQKFDIACGPTNLEEGLRNFLAWAARK